jgi:tetratricopeptide (TPR) repeat protein
MPARRRWTLLLLALGALTAVSYAPALRAGFVNFDDTGYIESNPPVAGGLRLANLRWALTGYHLSNWHPITWASHMADVELFGLEPRGHHAVNVLLHVVNVALLFVVLRSLTGRAAPSFAVSALFALHPANVESVAWIAQRKTLLSTLFALLAIASYARWTRSRSVAAYLASLGCLALSLLSKAMFVTFPFALLLLDYWPLRRAAFGPERDGRTSLAALVGGWLRLLPEKLPFLALCAATSLLTLDAQRDAMSTIENYAIGDRLGNVAISYVRYLGTFLLPRHLAVFYPLEPETLTPQLVAACAILLVAITALAIAFGRRRRHLLVGWLWYLLMLVPVIGLVQVGMQSMADRYVYVPFWGLFVAVVWSLRDALALAPARLASAVATGALALVLATYALLTWRQVEVWRDGITLFESALANTGRNWLAHGALAERYYTARDFPKAIEHSRAALQYNRNLGAIRSTYGLALYEMGDPDRALEQFELAVSQEPTNPLGYMNLGWAYIERGQYERAIENLAAGAQRIEPTTPPYTRKMTYGNWASALAKTNQLSASRNMYEQALAIDPKDADLLRDAARVDLLLGELDSAETRLRRAVEIDADDVGARYLLAVATLLRDRGDEAAALLGAAIGTDAREGLVAIELARGVAREGRRDRALRILDALGAATPADSDDARFLASSVDLHRAELAIEAGDAAAAIASLDRAVAVWPDNYDANNRLAFLLATSNDRALLDPARAVALAERAVAARREYGSLATLAAAYAAAGRMRDAVDVVADAQVLARDAGDQQALLVLEQQRRLYAGDGVKAER